jgi:hypothetical protein
VAVIIVSAPTRLPPELKAGGLEVCGLTGLEVEVSCVAAGATRIKVAAMGAGVVHGLGPLMVLGLEQVHLQVRYVPDEGCVHDPGPEIRGAHQGQ